ncbi:beta-lactamase family protein [bacterium]|nr:beta-lactamase family protein [bacterium]
MNPLIPAKRHTLCIGCCLMLAVTFVTAQTVDIPNDRMLRGALIQGVTMGIPGMSVAIGLGDSIAWTGTAGYSDLAKRIPVTREDRFGIGSITKTFVARVILQLAEEGRIDLDRTPAAYLDSDIVASLANSHKATLRQCINHQSGIPTWEFQPAWIRDGRGASMDTGHIWGKTETLAYIPRDRVPAEFGPGTRYSYSNTNYTLLGLVIEAVTGHDVMTEIRSRIFDPLGIDNIFLESFENIPGGYVHHYHYATPEFVRIAGVNPAFPEIRPMLVESTAGNLSPEWAAGGMVASADELVRWARAIRDGELLGEEMRKEVFTWYPPEENGNRAYHYLQGISWSADHYRGCAAYGHSGGTLGFTALMFWFADSDLIVVLLTNVGGMHSGLSPSPVMLFYREVLLPAVMGFVRASGGSVPDARSTDS